jgi:hypothetical protein
MALKTNSCGSWPFSSCCSSKSPCDVAEKSVNKAHLLVWSLTRNDKTDCSLCENCHPFVKSEVIACARRCLFILVNRVVDKKRIIRKLEGQGGREAQGVADHPPPPKKGLFIYANHDFRDACTTSYDTFRQKSGLILTYSLV